MTPHLSSRVTALKPSATLAVAARARALKAAGVDVLDLSTGEPDTAPAECVREAASAHVLAGPSRYTDAAGMGELRAAAAQELSRVHGVQWAAQNVLVSCGAKHSITNAMLALLEPGDEVIVCAPYWVSYPEMATVCGATPVVVRGLAEDGFVPTAQALQAVITPRTRMLVLNFPSNPTGAVASAAQLRALVACMAEHAPQAWVLSDDIYRQLCFGVEVPSIVRAAGDLSSQLLIVDGVSKAHAMTGYRIGFLAGDPAVIAAAAKLQSQMTSGPTTSSQHAAIAALTDPSVPATVAAMLATLAGRRERVVHAVAAMPDVTLLPPAGAFYAFLDLRAHPALAACGGDDVALATALLDRAQLALVPGSAFGAPGFVRMSFALDDAALDAALARLPHGLQAIATPD